MVPNGVFCDDQVITRGNTSQRSFSMLLRLTLFCVQRLGKSENFSKLREMQETKRAFGRRSLL